MRVYVDSKKLADVLKVSLKKRGITQLFLSQELHVTQGQISHILAGRFKTANSLVKKICTYVQIDLSSFAFHRRPRKMDDETLEALARACMGGKRKVATVIKVLRALENLEYR